MLAGYAQASVVIDPANMAGTTGMIGARGANILGDWRSDLINPDTGMNMDMAYPERSEMGQPRQIVHLHTESLRETWTTMERTMR